MIHLISSIDLSVLKYLYFLRNATAAFENIWLSELASTTTVAGLSVCIVIILAARRMYASASGFILTVAGSAATTFILKEIIRRARPDTYYWAYYETGFSFPSGHATLSIAFWGAVVFLLWQTTSSKLVRTLLLVALVITVSLVDFSRLYLGVHYLSDVVAGTMVGGVFLFAGIRVTKRLSDQALSRSAENSL